MAKNNKKDSLDSTVFGWGFVIGLLLGGIGALFKSTPNFSINRQQLTETGQTLRSKLESVTPSDPIVESIAEGKAAAQRRRSQLGLDS
jgi:hypothetical protein